MPHIYLPHLDSKTFLESTATHSPDHSQLILQTSHDAVYPRDDSVGRGMPVCDAPSPTPIHPGWKGTESNRNYHTIL